MKITIHHTEVGRYAHISATTGQEIDLPLEDGLPTAQSLRMHAEMRRHQQCDSRIAALIEEAADHYESPFNRSNQPKQENLL